MDPCLTISKSIKAFVSFVTDFLFSLALEFRIPFSFTIRDNFIMNNDLFIVSL